MGETPCHECMRIALKFAYNGMNFSGYARQPGLRTVEQALLELLVDRKILTDVRESGFRTASRTDRGASALGNVCAFDTVLSKEEIITRLPNNPTELFIYGIQEVTSGFYPRHAIQRIYRYYLPQTDLNVECLLSAAALFTGEHNFQNFARVEPLKNPIRTIDTIILGETKDFLVLDFYAQTFLWNQIRRIVSALKKVGEAAISLHDVHSALEHPEKKIDFQVAPPEPLLLKDVLYDFSFDYQNNYKKKLLGFETNIVSRLVRF